jgi:predicted esterase YcpF (UPF0227 family)
MTCGLTAVRLRADGQYVCRACGQELGENFIVSVNIELGGYWAQRLHRQCAAAPPLECDCGLRT